MAAISDVARAANVSKSTVSRVLNDTAPISEAVRTRVLAAVDALDYRPSNIARSLSTGRSSMVGVLVPDIGNPYYPEVLRGIEAVLVEEGYSLLLASTGSDVVRVTRVVEVLVDQRADGIVSLAPLGDDLIRFLLDRRVPLVLRRPAPETPTPGLGTVDTDLGDAIADAIRHLTDLGHRRIGFVGANPGHAGACERLSLFRVGLERASVAFCPALVGECALSSEGGRAAGHALLALPAAPTAILAFNDIVALGVLRAASECRLRVPDDLSVIGVDDVSLASLVTPALTTVALPIAAVGASLARSLVGLIRGGAEQRHVALRGRLVVRQSTGVATTHR